MKQTALTGKLLLGALYTSIAVAILTTAILVVPTKSLTTVASIAGQKIKADIADTPLLQKKGLSGRKALKENEGMLFIFSEPGIHEFWMKDMLFSIDIIWLDADRKVVDMWENASPNSYPEVHTPRELSQYVLEVNAGFVKTYTIKKGDILELETHARYTN